MQLPETTHFKIEHRAFNAGTIHHEFAVVDKQEKTSGSTAMVPMPVTANSPELLVDDLLRLEAWYVRNRGEA
jgi:hypothetical protein